MRLNLPEQSKLVFESVVPIRWGDMDAYGHVNNTVYFRYMEIARIDWLDSIAARIDAPGQGIVVVNAFCNFHAQLHYPGDLSVRMSVANPGRSSFETYYEIVRRDDPATLYASGGAKTVWIDHAQRRSAPLPPGLRALLEAPAA